MNKLEFANYRYQRTHRKNSVLRMTGAKEGKKIKESKKWIQRYFNWSSHHKIDQKTINFIVDYVDIIMKVKKKDL